MENNAYYHVSVQCVTKKHPQFHSTMVTCPEEVRSKLQAAHFELLKLSIGYP